MPIFFKRPSGAPRPRNEYRVVAILAALALVARVPFWRTFEMVAYDGTYYLNQARTLFTMKGVGAFPIGYPAAAAVFHTVVRDWQLAGQMVSLAAAVGSTILAYCIARRFVSVPLAALAAVAISINPIIVRVSLMTLSESLFIFWLLLGLLAYLDRRHTGFGAAMGLAAITRPEALGVAAILGLARLVAMARGRAKTAGEGAGRRALVRAALAMAIPFLALYVVNNAALSARMGRTIIVPKSEYLGASAHDWKLRESAGTDAVTRRGLDSLQTHAVHRSITGDYAARLPVEVWRVFRLAGPVVLVLALVALRRRRYAFLAACMAPFLISPLVTVRGLDRYAAEYVPPLILLGVFGAAELRAAWARRLAIAALAAAAVVVGFTNRPLVLEPEEPGLVGMKRAGLAFRDEIDFDDRIAGRKPFFAFYAGGRYVELPVAPYEGVMAFLDRRGVEYLALHRETIHRLRPALRPLMYRRAVINGELRFRQSYFADSGEMVFTRVRTDDPLVWRRSAVNSTSARPPRDPAASQLACAPAFSPDESLLAYRRRSAGGNAGEIVAALTPAITTTVTGARTVATAPYIRDELSWSPDGAWLAFARDSEIVAVRIADGRTARLVRGNRPRSPSWSPRGDAVFYSDGPAGSEDIWRVDVDAAPTPLGSVRLTRDGGNTHPSVSPDATRLAWIKADRALVLAGIDGADPRPLPAPRRVQMAPCWSPDGRTLAVTARDWGTWDIYLVKADGSNALLMTHRYGRVAMPAWHPGGDRMVVASDHEDGAFALWELSGVPAYVDRLDHPEPVRVFAPIER